MSKYAKTTCINCEKLFTFNQTGASYIARRYCKECREDMNRINRKKRHDATLARNALIVKDIHFEWAKYSIKNHIKLGHTCNIDVNELASLARKTTHCLFCTESLKYHGTGSGKSATVDRIKNGNSYGIIDIQIICTRCNLLKGNMGFDHFKNMIKGFVKSAIKTEPEFRKVLLDILTTS